MERLNRSAVKKMDINSLEYETPQYLWDEYWNLMQFTTSLNKNALDIFKPLDRKVTRLLYV